MMAHVCLTSRIDNKSLKEIVGKWGFNNIVSFTVNNYVYKSFWPLVVMKKINGAFFQKSLDTSALWYTV